MQAHQDAGTLGCGLEWRHWDRCTEVGVLGWGEHQGEPGSGKVSWNALGCRNTGAGGITEHQDEEHQDEEAAGMRESADG